LTNKAENIDHKLDDLYNGLEGIPITPGVSGPQLYRPTQFIDPTGVHMPKGTWIGSAALAGLTGV